MTNDTTEQVRIDPSSLVDIWSRPGEWAHQRAYIFLFINFVVYAGLNTFLFWIHRAKLFDFSWASYTVMYHKTLIDFLFYPISLSEAPVLIPILGMLMAIIIAVPILVSQLYGFRYSIAFPFCVLILAHLPMLSLFLLISCMVASISKEQIPFKFGVTLIGLSPIVLYFYIATRGAGVLRLKSIDPTLLYAPWVLAFLAASGISASVLAAAKLLKYRPGGILISMIPFFVIPGILFNIYIGRDQLEFRLMAYRYIPGKSMTFTPVDLSGPVFDATIKKWRRYKIHDLQEIVDLARFEFPFASHVRLQKDRHKVISACEHFRKSYPKSKFMPNVLYVLGLAQDMRFDYTVLRKKWMLEYHTNLVSPQSRSTWLKLFHDYPNSIYSLPAMFRLSVLAVREGNITRARELLQRLIKFSKHMKDTAASRPASRQPKSFIGLFAEPTQTDIPQINLPRIIERAQELLALINNNADDKVFGAKPLAELMRLDPAHPRYRDHLLELAIKFSGAKLHDNLLVRYAMEASDPKEREKLLRRYVKLFKGTDAGAEALYHLARLMQSFGLVNIDPQSYNQAEEYYRTLIHDYPNSIFASRAKKQLKSLENILEKFYE